MAKRKRDDYHKGEGEGEGEVEGVGRGGRRTELGDERERWQMGDRGSCAQSKEKEGTGIFFGLS